MRLKTDQQILIEVYEKCKEIANGKKFTKMQQNNMIVDNSILDT